MGHPAQEEGQDRCCKHAQYLVIPRTGAFLDLPRAHQCTSDQAVTGDDDDEGHQEAQQAFHQAECQPDLLQDHGVFNGGVENATHCRVVCDVVDVPDQGCGHTQHKGKQPDHYAGDACVQHGAQPARPHGVDDGEVPVDAERREEEDAGVEVKNHQPCTGLAQEFPKGPVIARGGEGGPHGQSDEEVPDPGTFKQGALSAGLARLREHESLENRSDEYPKSLKPLRGDETVQWKSVAKAEEDEADETG
ncbi:hypothetical protein EYF80_001537 [Liparis tanakae]|uniref:Uncharacterized protein n=1 Tax=Liparis tanakae TaxID=230148 RepID=A0A4Z2JE93_9TELE|nr:hypothetical protein EYF80_001537 [Liparis tanakae]